MKKHLYRIVFLLLVGFLIYPQVTLAVWWNPFTWKIFRTATTTPSVNTDPLSILNVPASDALTQIKPQTPPTKRRETTIDQTPTQTITIPSSGEITAFFDENVIRSLFQIQIWDITLNKYVVWGTGVAISGSTILTNYHVAKEVFLNPQRYKAYACETISLNAKPNCVYSLSVINTVQKFLGGQIITPKYSEQLDLALLYIDNMYVDNVWKSILDIPLNLSTFNTVNLSSYTKEYGGLRIGDSVSAIGYPDYGGEKTIQVTGTVQGFEKDTLNNFGQVLILSDFKISHGNSGGPVFNLNGELVGVVAQCIHGSSGKCVEGLFIPLPTVNWWYINQTNSEISTWNGSSFYTLKDTIPNDVVGGALCTLRKNAYYDPTVSTDGCVCKAGYSKDIKGDCVNGADSSVQDNPISNRYGKDPDPEAEKRALQMLEEVLGALENSSQQQKDTTQPKQNKITIQVPNKPGFFVVGEEQTGGLWNIYFDSPALNRRSVIKIGSTKEMFDKFIKELPNQSF